MENKKVALVTGASRGIGKAIALKFAKEGYMVVINYNGSEEKAVETKAEINASGGMAETVKCDVSDFKQCENLIKDIIKKYGKIDVLVNNAGITKDGLIMRMSEEDFMDVINVNLKGVFNCIRHASRYMMKQRSGKIINIASVVGVAGNVGQANYAAAKAGVIGLTKSAAKELASRNITVNAIAPGFIETDMTSVLSDDVKEKLKSQIPLGRFGSAEDVANATLFLASLETGYITGQVFHVDGGMIM